MGRQPKKDIAERGFTLVELMIVVIVIGILAAIAIPNFLSLRQKSIRSSCVANQRNIVQGATLYASENGITNAVINVGVLQSSGYASMNNSECPQSTLADYDDYVISIINGRVHAISCSVNAADHSWTPPQ